jgi:hypothetical protein
MSSHFRCLAALSVLSFCFSAYSLAQTTAAPANDPAATGAQSPLPDSPSSSKRKQEKTEEQRKIEREEQSRKILGIVPQYNVTSLKTALPLTPSEKFHLFVKSSFTPFEFAAVGFQAGLSQASDQFPQYGQGAEGYGKRYGAAFADQISSGFFSNYAYPVIFREDPRYFRSGEGSIAHRTVYSITHELIGQRDGGRTTFSFSNVLGAFTSGAISNVYYPSNERSFGDTMSRSAIALAYGAAGNLASEFWPDVHDKWLTKHKKTKDKNIDSGSSK